MRTRRQSNLKHRRGAVAVEFAMSAGILFLLIFSAVEFSRMNMIRHTADNAAYEAARRAIVPGASAADARATAQSIMRSVSASGVTVDVDPEFIQNSTPEVVVTVTVPADGNGFLAPNFFRGRIFEGQCRLAREDL